jgi:hypothetical protein
VDEVKMDRRRAMMWAILVGSTLFTLYSLWPAGKPAGVAATPPGAAAKPGSAPAPAAVAPAPPISEHDWQAWHGQLPSAQRDPFFTLAEIAEMGRPPVVRRETPTPVAPPAYSVKLVMMTGSQGRALIGDQVVKVGDMLGDERVIEIRRGEVVLEHSGARRRLELATGAPLATSGSKGNATPPEKTP